MGSIGLKASHHTRLRDSTTTKTATVPGHSTKLRGQLYSTLKMTISYLSVRLTLWLDSIKVFMESVRHTWDGIEEFVASASLSFVAQGAALSRKERQSACS